MSLEWAASGGTANAQIDSAGIKRMQHAEGLCNLERTVMGQQDSTGTHADGRSLRRYPGNQHFRCGAGQGLHGVMFGDPIAGVAKPLGESSEIDGVVKGVCRSRSGGHWGLIYDGEI